jgi:hypothetical protein
MWKSDWDYNQETDKLPKNITILIVVASIVAAVYLSMILV